MTVVGREMYSDNGGERDVYTVKMAEREREMYSGTGNILQLAFT